MHGSDPRRVNRLWGRDLRIGQDEANRLLDEVPELIGVAVNFQEEGHVTLSAPGTSTTIPIHPDAAKQMRPDLLLYYVDRADLAGKMYLFSARQE